MTRPEHDVRIRNIDHVWRTHCNCGWRSDLHPDQGTAWSEGQAHVVMAMEASDRIAEARRAALWEAQLDADGWQVDPDILAAQERVRAAERDAESPRKTLP